MLAYDLLEDRRTTDVINSKFFPLCFKMTETFENLGTILRDWVKDKVQKVLPRQEAKREEVTQNKIFE